MLNFLCFYLLFGFFIFWITFFMQCFDDFEDFEDFEGRLLSRIGYTFLSMYYNIKSTRIVFFIIVVLVESVLWPFRLWAIYTKSGREAYEIGLNSTEYNNITNMLYKDDEND